MEYREDELMTGIASWMPLVVSAAHERGATRSPQLVVTVRVPTMGRSPQEF
jgi:hypothetical protein